MLKQVFIGSTHVKYLYICVCVYIYIYIYIYKLPIQSWLNLDRQVNYLTESNWVNIECHLKRNLVKPMQGLTIRLKYVKCPAQENELKVSDFKIWSLLRFKKWILALEFERLWRYRKCKNHFQHLLWSEWVLFMIGWLVDLFCRSFILEKGFMSGTYLSYAELAKSYSTCFQIVWWLMNWKGYGRKQFYLRQYPNFYSKEQRKPWEISEIQFHTDCMV
jgi:hypothetical protein